MYKLLNIYFFKYLGQDLESRSSQPRETPIRHIEELKSNPIKNTDDKRNISVQNIVENSSSPIPHLHVETATVGNVKSSNINVKKQRKESVLKHHFLMDKFQNSRREIKSSDESDSSSESWKKLNSLRYLFIFSSAHFSFRSSIHCSGKC